MNLLTKNGYASNHHSSRTATSNPIFVNLDNKTANLEPITSVTGNLALLESGDYSDMVSRCGSDIYKLHRSNVCSRFGSDTKSP